MAALTDSIRIRREHWDEMLAHVSQLVPEEACGIAAGRDGITTHVYLVENALHSPVRFRMDAQQQVDAILEIEDQGQDLLAIFHSHPAGPPVPSPTDVESATFPEAVNLIWSKPDGQWTCRGFLIQRNVIKEVTIQVEDLFHRTEKD
jgi:proteasome lid subunit RPN8/RPN11